MVRQNMESCSFLRTYHYKLRLIVRHEFCNFFILLSNCSRCENRGRLFFSNDKCSTSMAIKLIGSAVIRCVVLFFLIYVLEAENNKISSFTVSTEVALKVLNEFYFVEIHG